MYFVMGKCASDAVGKDMKKPRDQYKTKCTELGLYLGIWKHGMSAWLVIASIHKSNRDINKMLVLVNCGKIQFM